MSEEEMLSLNNYLEDLYQAWQIGDIVFEAKHSGELYNLINKLLEENQKYKEVIEKAIDIAYQYGQIDGEHHKIWTIDQMVRQLLGNKYDNFVKEYEEGGEYSWNTGIAP